MQDNAQTNDINPQPTNAEVPSVPTQNVDPFDKFEKNRIEQSKEKNEVEAKKEISQTASKKASNPKQENPKEPVKDLKQETSEPEQENPELVILRNQIEKERKNALEAQRWGTKNSQKVKNVEKSLKALLESAALASDEEEEVNKILTILSSKDEPHIDIPEPSRGPAHPMQKYWEIANTELENFRKYNGDNDLDVKVQSFNDLVRHASQEELGQIIVDLESIENDIGKMKKMLSLGEQYYNDGYKEVLTYGTPKKLVETKNKEIERLSKELEKYKKKLTEYENYDNKPVYGIKDSGNLNNDNVEAPKFTDAFDKFEHNRQTQYKQRAIR
jgi:hypothetical protein